MLSSAILGAAIEVHQYLGPGLLESVYEECLCHELAQRRIAYERQLQLPIVYKGCAYNATFELSLLSITQS